MFALTDLRARMYMAYGSSMKSEKDDRAMGMVHDIDIDSVRPDRYYSTPAYVSRFGSKVYIMPKRDSTLKGPQKWKDTMKGFIRNARERLGRYHLGDNSEAGLGADRRTFRSDVE